VIRVLLVDDHPILSQGLRRLLEREPDIKVEGEARNGREAVEMALELIPDVVVMDIAMPELNGIDATRQIVAKLPDTKVLALSARADRQVVTEVLRAGASGFSLKETTVDDLVTALRTVASGQTYLNPQVVDLVGGATDDGPMQRLTPREREVLQLIAEGKATKEVAYALRVSIKTAETHRRSIMEKLNLHSVAELTKLAVREGLSSLS
jgi:DNA-binding NarL/FixJ family response regulator